MSPVRATRVTPTCVLGGDWNGSQAHLYPTGQAYALLLCVGKELEMASCCCLSPDTLPRQIRHLSTFWCTLIIEFQLNTAKLQEEQQHPSYRDVVTLAAIVTHIPKYS